MAGKIVMGDMGPKFKSGKTEMARRGASTSHCRPRTRSSSARRGVAPSGWIRDYVERSLSASEIKPGEWVAVSIEGHGQRRAAAKITVVDTSEH
jgi:hypothetical protein